MRIHCGYKLKFPIRKYCGYIKINLRILADTYYILGVISHVSVGWIRVYMNVSAKVYPEIRTRILMYTKSIRNVYANGNKFFRLVIFFYNFIGRKCFAASVIILVKVLFAFSILSELFVNDVVKKFWIFAFISLLQIAAL